MQHVACGILVPGLGIEPAPPAVKTRSLNHWTIREVVMCAFQKQESRFSSVLGPRKVMAGAVMKREFYAFRETERRVRVALPHLFLKLLSFKIIRH